MTIPNRRKVAFATLAVVVVAAALVSTSIVFGMPLNLQSDGVLPGSPEMRLDNTNAQAGSISVTASQSQTVYSGVTKWGPGLCVEKVTINDEAGSMKVDYVAFGQQFSVANLTQSQSVSLDAPGAGASITVTGQASNPLRGSGLATGTYAISTPVCQNEAGAGEVIEPILSFGPLSNPAYSLYNMTVADGTTTNPINVEIHIVSLVPGPSDFCYVARNHQYVDSTDGGAYRQGSTLFVVANGPVSISCMAPTSTPPLISVTVFG